jgi:phage terminase small subunit
LAQSLDMEKARSAATTARWDRFCVEYLQDYNASRAAAAAGYKGRWVGRMGWHLLQQPYVQKRLARLAVKATKKAEVTLEDCVAELKAIAFSDGAAYFPKVKDGKIVPPDVDGMTEDQKRAVSEVCISKGAVRVSRFDKLRAMEQLTKLLGFAVDRVHVEGADQPLVIIQQVAPPTPTAPPPQSEKAKG